MVHIQNASEASVLIPHWGYASRSFPCTNDAGSCEYLDAVYWMHDVSMLYTFIMWAVIGGILVLWMLSRLFPRQSRQLVIEKPEEGAHQEPPQGFLYRSRGAIAALCRKHLLPEAFGSFFGHVTRLQILILAILFGYLLIFSFVGMVYKTWVTPVKGSPGLYNTRVTMGGFSDRIGALAFALTPFTVALSTRESILTLMTGVSYQHFNFLHTWCGRVIFIQAFVHTLIWAVIEGRLYQPQPTVGADFIKQEYMIWGCVVMILLTFLFVGSFKSVINWTGHEFFRKTHYIIAAIYLGACWAHWSALACWMIASLAIFFIDRILRLARSGLIHVGHHKEGGYGFQPINATMKCFDDDTGSVIRIYFSHSQGPWRAGQHFFLCFPELSIWQSHPFTVMSLPSPRLQPSDHVYIVRSMSGQTSKLAKLAREKQSTGETTSVIMTGPYGTLINEDAPNFLAIAGGTGISFALPLALEAASQIKNPGRRVQLVWAIRHSQDLEWVAPELEQLKQLVKRPGSNLHVQIFITREKQTAATSDSDDNSNGAKSGTGEKTSTVETPSRTLHDAHDVFTVTSLEGHHPDLNQVIAQFLEQTTSGRTQVVASGPSGMGTDLRRAVARSNDCAKSMKGNEKWDVSLYVDNRFN